MNITVTLLSAFVLSAVVRSGHSMVTRRRRMQEGTPANAAEFKFLVQIIFTTGTFSHCVGSLVRRDWVLTAASCIFDIPEELINVIAGASTLYDPLRVQAEVTQAHTHHMFRRGEPAYDVALLKLKMPLFGANIRPVPYSAGVARSLWLQGYIVAVSYDFNCLIQPPHALRMHYTGIDRLFAIDCRYRMQVDFKHGLTMCTLKDGHKVFTSCDGGAPIIHKRKVVAVVAGPYLRNHTVDVSNILRPIGSWLERIMRPRSLRPEAPGSLTFQP